jgi:hypothetical protein
VARPSPARALAQTTETGETANRNSCSSSASPKGVPCASLRQRSPWHGYPAPGVFLFGQLDRFEKVDLLLGGRSLLGTCPLVQIRPISRDSGSVSNRGSRWIWRRCHGNRRNGCSSSSKPRSPDTSVSHFCPTARQNHPKIPHSGDRSVHSYTSHNKRLRSLQLVATFQPGRSFNPWVQGSSP